MSKSSNLILITTICFAVAAMCLTTGCGNDQNASWPSNPKNDWIKNVSGRGMANVWGVIFDVEEFNGESSINPSGEFGSDHSDTNAANDILFGTVAIKLETTGKRFFKLNVNGKQYGTVTRGDRVKIDKNRDVIVNDSLRESK